MDNNVGFFYLRRIKVISDAASGERGHSKLKIILTYVFCVKNLNSTKCKRKLNIVHARIIFTEDTFQVENFP